MKRVLQKIAIVWNRVFPGNHADSEDAPPPSEEERSNGQIQVRIVQHGANTGFLAIRAEAKALKEDAALLRKQLQSEVIESGRSCSDQDIDNNFWGVVIYRLLDLLANPSRDKDAMSKQLTGYGLSFLADRAFPDLSGDSLVTVIVMPDQEVLVTKQIKESEVSSFMRLGKFTEAHQGLSLDRPVIH